MDSYQTRFDDAQAFAKVMAQAPAILQEEMIKSADKITDQGVRWSREKMEDNGSVRTRDTWRSIASDNATFAGGQVIGTFGTAAISAIALEKGRKGFGPVRKKALAFQPRYAGPVQGRRMNIRKKAVYNVDGSFAVDQKRGRGNYTGLVVVKRVGPAEPRPFMKPTAVKLKPYVPKEFKAAVQRTIARIIK